MTAATRAAGLGEALAAPFIYKSVSEETRSAYRRAVSQFFTFVGNIHPSQVTTAAVLAYRDRLITQAHKPATVAVKLSVVRSLFDYLKEGGYVERNPASTKLVPRPAIPDRHAGRALTRKEAPARPSSGSSDACYIECAGSGARVPSHCPLRRAQ